jgi:hypothetical protein
MTVDVHAVAAHLAAQHRSNCIIEIGPGHSDRLRAYAGDFFLVELDPGQADIWNVTDDQVANSVVVCAEVLEQVADPQSLLVELGRLREHAAALVLATRGRDRLTEFSTQLTEAGLAPAFVGLSRSDEATGEKNTVLAIVEGAGTPPLQPAPAGFRVLAVITGYNERDILPHMLRRLLADGVEVLYIDNWSTDGTLDAVRAEFGDAVATMRFPDTPPDEVALVDLLSHAERQALATGADWVINVDADEIRESPWPGVGLRDALWNVQLRGFNAVNFHVLVYRPTVADDIPDGIDPTTVLTHWDHLRRPSALVHVKAWRNTGESVGLGETGGHEATFPGRKIFPYHFLLRHYPLRSAAHGRRKVIDERLSRWSRAETEQRKWHHQYDHLAQTETFVWDATTLHPWDADTFARECLTERLFGLGVEADREPFRLPRPANPPTAFRAELAGAVGAQQELAARLTTCQEQRAVDRRKLATARKRLVASQQTVQELTERRGWRRTARLIRRRLTGSR